MERNINILRFLEKKLKDHHEFEKKCFRNIKSFYVFIIPVTNLIFNLN